MKTFTTPKGSELPLLDLRGKSYLQVAYRLVWFREEHPTWSIETEMVSSEPTAALFKAWIKDETGRIIAMAHKYEDKQGFADYREKGETGSIGRALALCGFGTQFCSDELEEGSRLADAPVQQVVRITNGIDNRFLSGVYQAPNLSEYNVRPALEEIVSGRDEVNREIMALYKPFLVKFPEVKSFQEFLMTHFAVNETKLMTIDALKSFVALMKKAISEGALPTTPSGVQPICDTCLASMVETAKKDAYRCSAWKKEDKVKHAYFGKDLLSGYIRDQVATKNWSTNSNF